MSEMSPADRLEFVKNTATIVTISIKLKEMDLETYIKHVETTPNYPKDKERDVADMLSLARKFNEIRKEIMSWEE